MIFFIFFVSIFLSHNLLADELLAPVVGAISGKGKVELLWTIDDLPKDELPKDLDIILIPDSLGKNIELPAVKLEEDRTVSKEKATCSYKSGTANCLYCPDDGEYYLDTKAIAETKGMKVVRVKSASTTTTLNMKAGKYFILTQFAPKGTQQSECAQVFVY